MKTGSLPTPWAILIFLAAAFFAYSESTLWIVDLWTRPRGWHVHGLLLAAMVVWLLWQSRELWRVQPSTPPSVFNWLFVLAGAGAWLVAWGVDLRHMAVLAFYVATLGGLLILLGRDSFATFGSKFAIIVFALPVWFNVSPILQTISTWATEALVRLFGVVIFVEGNTITIPDGVFEIEDGCSGLGMMLANWSLAGYLVASSKVNLRTVLIVFAVVTVWAMISNWVRITLIILAGHHLGMDHTIVHDHVTFGWIVHAILTLPLMFYGIRKLPALPPIPVSDKPWGRVATTRLLAALAIALSLPLLAELNAARSGDVVPGSTQAAERVEAPQISEDLLDIWHPQLTDVDYHNWFVPYAEQGDELLLFGIGYKEQPVGAQIVNRSAELVPEGWLSRDAGASGNQYRQMIVQGFSDDIYLIRYWFSIGGTTTANRWHAKLIRFQKKIEGRFDTEMVGLISRCDTQDCAAAGETVDNIYARITTDL